MEKFGFFQIQSWFRRKENLVILSRFEITAKNLSTQILRLRLRMTRLLGCFVLATTLTSCTIWQPILPPSEKPPGIPEELLNYYDYPRKPYDAVIVKEENEKHYILRQVEIPLHLPEDLWLKTPEVWKREYDEIKAANEKGARDLKLQYTNRLDMYLPKKMSGQQPVIVVSPILGGNMVVDIFAKYFAKHGFVAVIVNRKKSFYDESFGETEQVEKYLRSSIIRLRQAIDWLEVQPEVDPRRIGAFGISYGAVLHSVLAAIEPRVKAHILAMPAGDLPDVIMECPDKGVRKLVEHVENLGWPREKIYYSLKSTIVTDPIRFAPFVDKNKVMMFAAMFDRVVGSSRTFNLWNEMGRPKLKTIPLGHYGGLLVYPYLRWSSLQFFRSRL